MGNWRFHKLITKKIYDTVTMVSAFYRRVFPAVSDGVHFKEEEPKRDTTGESSTGMDNHRVHRGSGMGYNEGLATMNIVDEITEIIRQAPIKDLDLNFVERINPAAAYAGIEDKAEYKELIAAMVGMFEHAERNGLSRERAAAVMFGTYEDVVRYVINKAVRDRLFQIDSRVLNAVDIDALKADSDRTIVEAKAEIEKLTAQTREIAASKEVHQFKAYLSYAADKWGTPVEKKAIQSLIGRIKSTKAVRRKVPVS